MTLERLIHQTRERFPSYTESHVEIIPLEKGGSDRQYYRVRFSPEQSLILVKYNPERLENERFVAIAKFLRGVDVKVPAIYYHDPDQTLIWMEDLGEEDLWHHRNESWSMRRSLYESSLKEIGRLHRTNPHRANHLHLQRGFDIGLYRWEQNYCFDNCLSLYFELPPSDLEPLRNNPAFVRLADQLASYPRSLIHRDFQSQNVIVREEGCYLIDFQGLRLGLAQYDLASILFDPYVTFSPAERKHLINYYRNRFAKNWVASEFMYVFYRCAIQRLMQALGAYGVIGLLRGKREYLRYVQPAIKSLIEVASVEEEFNFLADFLRYLPDRPKPRI